MGPVVEDYDLEGTQMTVAAFKELLDQEQSICIVSDERFLT